MRRLLTYLLTIMVVVLAAARPAYAIAHGEDARDGDFSFSARLTMTGIPAEGHRTRDSWCSGALIAPTWVITAGHCFRDASGQRVSRPVAMSTTVTVGRTSLRKSQGHEVDVVAVRQSETADVALVKIATAITDIPPLPVADTPPAAGEKVRLTGYGFSRSGSTTPDRLQTGEFVVDRVGDAIVEISGTAPDPDTSACPHDSGGPYFRQSPPALVALVSSGPTCPHEGPDFTARVDNLSGWIAETITDEPGILDSMPVRMGGAVVLVLVLAAVVLRARRRRKVKVARGTHRVRAGM